MFNPLEFNELPLSYASADIPLDTVLVDYSNLFTRPTIGQQPQGQSISMGDSFANLQNQDLPTLTSFEYNSSLDYRFNDKNFQYNPIAKMEEIYAEKQGFFGVLGKRLDQFLHNSKVSAIGGWISAGRFLNNVQEGNFFQGSALQTPEQLRYYIQTINDDFYEPIYNKTSDFWSIRGGLGDSIASLGFTAGAIGKEVVNSFVGKGLTKHPIGIISAFAGIALSTNNTFREAVGEETASLMGGFLGEGLFAGAAFSGIDALTKAIPPKAIPVFSEFLKDFKTTKSFTQTVKTAVANSLDNVTSFRLLKSADVTNDIKKAIALNRGLKATSTVAVGYIKAGAEAGVEAMQSYYDYIGNRISEREQKGIGFSEEEYLGFHREADNVAKSVYYLNKGILTFTNLIEMPDIINNTFISNSFRNLGLKTVTKGYADELEKQASQTFINKIKNIVSKNTLKTEAKASADDVVEKVAETATEKTAASAAKPIKPTTEQLVDKVEIESDISKTQARTGQTKPTDRSTPAEELDPNKIPSKKADPWDEKSDVSSKPVDDVNTSGKSADKTTSAKAVSLDLFTK